MVRSVQYKKRRSHIWISNASSHHTFRWPSEVAWPQQATTNANALKCVVQILVPVHCPYTWFVFSSQNSVWVLHFTPTRSWGLNLRQRRGWDPKCMSLYVWFFILRSCMKFATEKICINTKIFRRILSIYWTHILRLSTGFMIQNWI